MIPQVIHRIWLGSNPMPGQFERYGETWTRHHPGWEIRLWTDSNLPDLTAPEAMERARNYGERSDLLRYEVLVRFGGVYVDTDMECLRSIEPLIEGVGAFAGSVREGKLGNAILGAAPRHPAFERLLAEASVRAGTGHVSGATGPRLLTGVLTSSEGVTVFPPETFYPFHRRRAPDGQADLSRSYAIHHVDASWKTTDHLREDIRRLRTRLERANARNQRARKSRRKLRRLVKRQRSRGRKLSRRARGTERRLRAVEASRWWRLRALLAAPLRRARARRRG